VEQKSIDRQVMLLNPSLTDSAITALDESIARETARSQINFDPLAMSMRCVCPHSDRPTCCCGSSMCCDPCCSPDFGTTSSADPASDPLNQTSNMLMPLDVLFSPKRNTRMGNFRRSGRGSLSASLSSSLSISSSLLRWKKNSHRRLVAANGTPVASTPAEATPTKTPQEIALVRNKVTKGCLRPSFSSSSALTQN